MLSEIEKKIEEELKKDTGCKHIVVTDDIKWKKFSEDHDGIFFMLDNAMRRKMLIEMFALSARYGNRLLVLCDYGFSNTSLRLPLMEDIRSKKEMFGCSPVNFEKKEVKIWEV